MSKASELRLLRGQRSTDAEINYRHRSGDSEGSGGSMLDYYAQEESAEEAYFEEQEESAREVFSRAFKLYLKKTLTGKERKFLSRVLSGREKPQEVGRALGVKWFEYMQAIQRKAFNNAEAFGRVVQLSGWSRAEEFAGAVFRRLRHLGETREELPPEKKRVQARAMMKAFRESAETERRTAINFRRRKWKAENREKIREQARIWRENNREKERERKQAWQEANRKRMREHGRTWRAMHQEKHREHVQTWRKANPKKQLEYTQVWRKKNREKLREYQKAYRAKKKAEKEAVKALAGLLILSQTQKAETSEGVPTME